MVVGFENFSIRVLKVVSYKNRVWKFWVEFKFLFIYYLCKYNQINNKLRNITLECTINGEMKGN
jgi:hypothetical protein